MLICPRLRILGPVAFALWCCIATGCGVIATSSTTAPKASAKLTETRTELDERGKPKATVTTVREAGATGTGATATGDKVNQKSEAQPANVSIDGISASGGGGKSNSSASGNELEGLKSPLLWVGIACLLFAAVAVWQGWKGIIIPAAGAGVVLIAVAFYPWLLLWAVLALVVIVGGPYIVQYVKGFRATEAARAIIAGVAQTSPEVQVQVQAAVASHADEADKATIRKIRKRDGIAMASDVKAMVTP